MLTLRAEQMSVFQPGAELAFVNRVVKLLRADHAEAVVRLPNAQFTVETMPDATIRHLVTAGIALGREFGLTFESALGGFVVLQFVVAPNFHENRVITKILNDADIPADARLDALWAQTSERTWDATRSAYDPKAWPGDTPLN